ncbi:hypothetical protein XA68_16657 [Ophiocordyceps unilateralis]|uniref:Uncharacterized protein n=1 Tax=Ophiocordyceps unilateralis TaxID=268505 RepID=A0A2A9PPD5_OPHUN|nr:hypothetical protein XA68_16657 [Ophiocordyceps unilateralis]
MPRLAAELSSPHPVKRRIQRCCPVQRVHLTALSAQPTLGSSLSQLDKAMTHHDALWASWQACMPWQLFLAPVVLCQKPRLFHGKAGLIRLDRTVRHEELAKELK